MVGINSQMEKIPSMELDMEEWEMLSDVGGLGIRKGSKFSKELPSFNPKGPIHMDYYICPSDPYEFLETEDDLTVTQKNHEFVEDDDDAEEEMKKSSSVYDKLEVKKFVDITKDVKTTVFKEEEEKNGMCKESEKYQICSAQKERRGCWGLGFSVWGWKLTGIGALCSIGMAAAATIYVLMLGSSQRRKNHHHDHNHKLQLQIYPDDKNLKQVMQHATKLNQAMSAVRGVPVPRANISFGGYYDGL